MSRPANVGDDAEREAIRAVRLLMVALLLALVGLAAMLRATLAGWLVAGAFEGTALVLAFSAWQPPRAKATATVPDWTHACGALWERVLRAEGCPSPAGVAEYWDSGLVRIHVETVTRAADGLGARYSYVAEGATERAALEDLVDFLERRRCDVCLAPISAGNGRVVGGGCRFCTEITRTAGGEI